MVTSGQCRAQEKSKIRKELAVPYGINENTQDKSENEKQGHRMDVHGKEKEIAGEKDAGFVFIRKIEEIDAEEDKEKHFQIRSCSQEERIVKNNFYKGEIRQDKNQEEISVDNRLEYFVDKEQKSKKNHELEQNKIQIATSKKIPEKSDT